MTETNLGLMSTESREFSQVQGMFLEWARSHIKVYAGTAGKGNVFEGG